MNTMRALAITAGAVLATASVWGQFTDSFTGTTINSGNWTSFTNAAGVVTQNGQMIYSTSGTTGSNDYAGLMWSGHPNYATSWSAQVDVLMPTLSLSANNQQYSAGIYVEGGPGSPSGNYNFSITLAPYYTTSFHSEYDSDLVTGGTTAVHPTTNHSGFQTSSTSAALKVDYNASTHVVTTYYDDNGSVGGYNWTQVLSWNIATGGTSAQGTTGGWGMGSSDLFNIQLVGTSANFTILTSDAVGLDNFSTTVSAVPEPSAYAAIFGAAALAGAMIRRRLQGTI